MRRVLALVLLLVVVFTAIPLTAQAAYENTYKNTGDQRADIVGVALTQVGYREGKGTGLNNNDTKYGDWAGWPGTEWCGWFVSWCANQANIPTSVLPKCGSGGASGWGFGSSYYTSSQYTPRSGDLFFKKNMGHVGIVYYVEGNYFYTLEGNTSTSGWEGHSVMIRRRALSEFYFASPRYTSDSGSSLPPAHTHSYQKSFESGHPHKEIARCACGNSYYTGETRTDANCSTCKAQNCDHNYGSWKDYNSSNHRKTCSKCGNAVNQSHSWVDDEVVKEPTCKDKGQVKQHCSVCNRTRTQNIDKLDEHIFKDWIDAGNGKHMRQCEFCDEKEEADHQIMVDLEKKPVFLTDSKSHWNQCADCGMKMQPKTHTLEEQFDDEYHWQFCQECQQAVDKLPHEFSHGCDNECNKCKFTRKTEHVYAEVLTNDDANTHWYACVNCQAKKDETAHSFILKPWEGDTQIEACAECGYLTGKVVVPTEWERLQKKSVACLTTLGSWIVPMELEGVWHMSIGIGAIVLALLILILTPCLIVRGVKKRKKKKAAAK